MEVYISDIKSDGSHPQSCGDSLEDRLQKVFPYAKFDDTRSLTGILNLLLNEIETQRNK